MRLLAMSDLHGSLSIYRKIPDLVSLHRADVLALAGDLLGAPPLPFMGGPFEKREEQFAEDLRSLEPLVDRRTILVAHSPAAGILDEGIVGARAGSSAILELVERCGLRAHVHGHVHDCFGRQGCHFNVASGGKRLRGMVLNLSTLKHEIFDDAPVLG
ncbi:MAG TPA: hypothetical protein VGK93_12660 [Candidatus Eisenbacteria bacterium]|jgi:Icc-related predicted phosphoesterase